MTNRLRLGCLSRRLEVVLYVHWGRRISRVAIAWLWEQREYGGVVVGKEVGC